MYSVILTELGIAVLEDEKLTEKYINIWCSHFFLKTRIWDLTKEYDCSKNTLKKAITFVNKMFVDVPNKELLQGSIFAIEERVRKLVALLEKELKRKEPSIRNIKELNSEIREDSRDLLKLQNLYKEKFDIEIEAGGSVKEILKVLSEQKTNG